MKQAELFLMFTRPLEASKVRYMVTGAAAAVAYGHPRMTHGIDLVVRLSGAEAGELSRRFPPDRFYCPPEEVLQIEIRRAQRGHFNVIHVESGFKADFYPAGNDPLNAWGLGHSRNIVLGGEAVRIAPPEYVIVRKLEYFREGGSEKHAQDIRAMTASLGPDLDMAFVRATAARMGLDRVLDGILGEDRA